VSKVVQITRRAMPPDQAERSRALDPNRSFLVQAPAGSGKTHLLTQRFLRLLGQAEKPDEIVAITFTKAAAAEMRNRILAELEKAESAPNDAADPESLSALASHALRRSQQMGWKILDQPSQLRITTIDAFCRGLALQSPLGWGLLSGLGGQLDLVENPQELYRRAARQTINLLSKSDSPERLSVEALLLWRDNNWKDVEDQIVEMLAARNRWYQDFVFARQVDWQALRRRLEAPFQRAAHQHLHSLCGKLDNLGGCREFALELARFACEEAGEYSPHNLAARSQLHGLPIEEEERQEAIAAYADLASFLLTKEGEWRSEGGLNKRFGFPATPRGRAEKQRFVELIESLRQEPGLLNSLAAFLKPLPLGYTDAEWELVRHCFAVLKSAALELQLVFSETGAVDFTEVSQIALRILAPENGFPSDFAIQQADGIRHLLVDEFQDTSRNQHQLLARLIAAWPEREGRSCFCVGDPMQSIYGFREAEVELFERLKTHGLEMESGGNPESFQFEFVALRANFRTAPSLVNDLNEHFTQIFAEDDGSGVAFTEAVAARASDSNAKIDLHLAFTSRKQKDADPAAPVPGDPEKTRQAQLDELVSLVRNNLERMKAERASSGQTGKFRIAVLGRTKKSLIFVAEALRKAGIGFRAIELVPLRQRSEVLDAIALARALLNPTDRTAWLGVLRAPWCGLSLADLHMLISEDNTQVVATPIPQLLETRLPALSEANLLSWHGQSAALRVRDVMKAAVNGRSSAAGVALGTWIESVWKSLGGEDTVNAEQRENLDLLWSAIDRLPGGEVDLVSAGLDTTLDKLCALPDPATSADFGVQLMTIHKSKGLEFEVVIVPDLEARSKASDPSMLSWLERGLVSGDADDNGALTEFLIAPFQPKGQDAGLAKSWVDSVKRQREIQEMRRVLYVAATRAREELHLFSRPSFTVNKKGEWTLSKPAISLLGTAWPALEDEIETQFSEWVGSQAFEETSGSPGNFPDGSVLTLAAAGSESGAERGTEATFHADGHLLPFPPAPRVTIVNRLPADYSGPASGAGGLVGGISPGSDPVSDDSPLYLRTKGGLYSRIEGVAIHSLLDQLSHLRKRMDPTEAAENLTAAVPGIQASIRGYGIPAAEAKKLATCALEVVQKAAVDPVGIWMLTPHQHSASESRWTGLIRGKLANLRPDRVFFAPGHKANEAGEESAWWIIDYKTSHSDGTDFSDLTARDAFLSQHRAQHNGQLTTYARILRGLHGLETPVRVGIYYPRVLEFDWWHVGPGTE
jgi:ATP-dependent helicase/nuclease subunit A